MKRKSGLTVLNNNRCGHALDGSATRATLEELFLIELSRTWGFFEEELQKQLAT